MIHSVRVKVQFDSLQFPQVMTLMYHLAIKKLAENEDLVFCLPLLTVLKLMHRSCTSV